MDTASTKNKTTKFHLGIYAIIQKDTRILLVKKSRGAYEGMWDLPGGRPNHGETILETLQREVKEETGIQEIDAKLYTNLAFVVEYQEGQRTISLHHVCLVYKAIRFDESSFKEMISEEDVTCCAWIQKSELSQLPVSKVVSALM